MARRLRRLLWSLGGLAVLMVAFHVVENARARQALKAWRAEQEAKGVPYTWASILPPAVPDADNFAKAPLLASAMVDSDHAKGIQGIRLAGMPTRKLSWENGESEDLGAWAEALHVKDARETLASMKAPLDELVDAARRPKCRLPIEESNLQMPGLLGFRQAGRALRLRALCRLQDGDPQGALEDTLAILRMGEHLRLEPQLISQLLHVALLKIGMQPVWEGLGSHRWRDADLARLQEVLSEVDLLASLQRTFHGERLYLWTLYGQIPAVRPWVTPGEERSFLRGGLLFPSGWYLRNLIASERQYLEVGVYSVDPVRHLAFPRRVDLAMAAQAAARTGPYNCFAQISTPALTSQVCRFIRLQASVDQAVLACALERYRLARKVYPSTLEALVPAYVAKAPRDLINGEPLRYELHPEGRYRLWSVGWDGKDDGGRVNKADGKPDPMTGDWVWP